MSSNPTTTDVRSETQHATDAPATSRVRTQQHPRRRRGRPRSATILLSLAGALAAGLYVTALTVLSDAAGAANELGSWGGSAALSAMIVMYAVIAAFVLLFTTAYRSTDQN